MKLPKAPFFTDMIKRDTPHQESIAGNVTINIQSALEEILGWSGRMVGASKSDYSAKYPDHDIFFNACIFTEDGTQVWFGDLDITLDNAKLQAAANAAKQKLYVTPEQPYRWDGLHKSMQNEYESAKRWKRPVRLHIYEPKEEREDG